LFEKKRAVAVGLVGGAIDVLVAPVVPMLKAGPSAPKREGQSVVGKSGERRLDLLELRDVRQPLGISLAEFVRRFEGSLR